MSQKLQALVADVLKGEARRGQTTKRGATLLVMNKIQNGGGPEKYGIGRAEMHMALAHIVGNAVDRQFKSSLPDNVIHHAFRNAPPEIAQTSPKLPAWIATSEGSDARWVPSLQASPEDWMATSSLKNKKARQTQKKSDAAASIARYLKKYGMSSLSDVLPVAEAAE